MSNKDFQLLNIDKKDQRYEKVWLAAMNPTEFQRLLRFENCELISVSSICDEIAEKLNEDASQLVATELGPLASKPMRSFLVASQLFIGLVYVHERQVKFLYDFVSCYTIPTSFLIDNNQNIVAEAESEEEMDRLPLRSIPTKGLKRKSSTKIRRRPKRKISLTLDTSDDHDDIEAQNLQTMNLLQSAVVSKNADISIREPDPVPVSESNEFVYCMDLNEDILAPERNDFCNAIDALLEDVQMPMTLNQPQDENLEDIDIPTDMCEPTAINDAVIENVEKIATSQVEEEVVELERGPENGQHSPADDSFEMSTLAPPTSNASIRRKRAGRNLPLKDITLSVNVQKNVKTASTTQRHLCPRDDSVSVVACLHNLTGKFFAEPSHNLFSESMARQFESKRMSDKLLQNFKRMTLTKTEETNRGMVQEFCSDLLSNKQQPATSMPTVEDSVTVAASYFDQLDELFLPDIEISVDGCNRPPLDEQIFVPPIVEPRELIVEPEIFDDPAPVPAESFAYEHASIELPSTILQILVNNEPVEPITRCNTDSQKQFASRSRQNKNDWGKEGVLRKLVSLWNSNIYPIAMKEIMQANNQRMSGATAFFSLMELSSARIGLTTITKCPDSNVIFNISKSAKFIELQEML